MNWRDIGADIVIATPQGLLIVEVKRDFGLRASQQALEQLRHHKRRFGEPVVATILADFKNISIYRGMGGGAAPAATLSTSKIMKSYDPDFESQIIYESYLESLMQRWLNDFAFSQSGTTPPGASDLPKDIRELLAT